MLGRDPKRSGLPAVLEPSYVNRWIMRAFLFRELRESPFARFATLPHGATVDSIRLPLKPGAPSRSIGGAIESVTLGTRAYRVVEGSVEW